MIQMRLEGCGGKVGPWVEEGLLLLASRDVGVQMRVGDQFKRSRSPRVAQVRWRSDNTEASNRRGCVREGGMFTFVCSLAPAISAQ